MLYFSQGYVELSRSICGRGEKAWALKGQANLWCTKSTLLNTELRQRLKMARMGQGQNLIRGKVLASLQLKNDGIIQDDDKSSFLWKVMNDALLVSQAIANFKRRAFSKIENSPSHLGKNLVRIWLFYATTQSLHFHLFRAPEQFVLNTIFKTWEKVALDCLWDLAIISPIWPLIPLGIQSSAASKLWNSYFHPTSLTFILYSCSTHSSGQLSSPKLLSPRYVGLSDHGILPSFLPFIPFPRAFWNTFVIEHILICFLTLL